MILNNQIKTLSFIIDFIEFPKYIQILATHDYLHFKSIAGFKECTDYVIWLNLLGIGENLKKKLCSFGKDFCQCQMSSPCANGESKNIVQMQEARQKLIDTFSPCPLVPDWLAADCCPYK